MIFDFLFMFFFILLGLLFIGLRLGRVIDWSWILVLLPFVPVFLIPAYWAGVLYWVDGAVIRDLFFFTLLAIVLVSYGRSFRRWRQRRKQAG